jgi:hypothetical protein
MGVPDTFHESAVTPIATGEARRSFWPWKSHGKISLPAVVALLPLTLVFTGIKVLPRA